MASEFGRAKSARKVKLIIFFEIFPSIYEFIFMESQPYFIIIWLESRDHTLIHVEKFSGFLIPSPPLFVDTFTYAAM